MSRGRRIALRTDASHVDRRLDAVLVEHADGLTRSQIKVLVSKELVTIDGFIATKAGILLQSGQLISVEVPEAVPLDLTPREVGIELLYEDEDVAVLSKPAGLSVHPSTTEQGPTVVHGLLHSLKSLSSVGGVERPGIVHRIDKGTSGVLVVSKTDRAHAGLSAQFKAHTIDRRYQALVYGDLEKIAKAREGRIETFYGRHAVNRKKMTGKLEEGRKAVTNWTLLETLPGPLTLVECRLETGRTHQLRVHLSELGAPVVGDPLYCENERRAKLLLRTGAGHERSTAALVRLCATLTHQLLHAFRLGFEHPVTGKRLLFESPLPADFAEVLSIARAL